jgi:hypothetical protein
MSRASGKGNQMKTPEEIKNDLKIMARNWRGWSVEAVANNTLAYIEQLEEQLANRDNLIDVLEDKSDENT